MRRVPWEWAVRAGQRAVHTDRLGRGRQEASDEWWPAGRGVQGLAHTGEVGGARAWPPGGPWASWGPGAACSAPLRLRGGRRRGPGQTDSQKHVWFRGSTRPSGTRMQGPAWLLQPRGLCPGLCLGPSGAGGGLGGRRGRREHRGSEMNVLVLELGLSPPVLFTTRHLGSGRTGKCTHWPRGALTVTRNWV